MPDHAYGHCLAVLRDPAAAESAACAAMVKGGISRTSVLAHARFAALEAAPSIGGSGGAAAGDSAVPDDITELAWLLADTRPAVERALIDLDGRHQLDRARLGRTLGLPAGAAAARLAEVVAAWAEHLDPALLAHLGPGDCPDLEAVLEGAGVDRTSPPQSEPAQAEPVPAEPVPAAPPPAAPLQAAPPQAAPPPTAPRNPPPPTRLGELLGAVPAIHEHISGCERCHDRARAMVTTRALISQTPLERAPEAVRDVARRARFRRPALLPPPLDTTGTRRVRPAVVGAGLIIASLVAAGGVAVDRHVSRDNRSARVAALTQQPRGGNALIAVPSVLGSASPSIAVTNTSTHSIAWQARPDPAWLVVSPTAGQLPAGATTVVTAHLLDGAPGGKLAALVTVTGDDGSTAAVQVQAANDQRPDVAATVSGCTVTAEVVDPFGVGDVSLHWMFPAAPGTAPVDMEAPMAAAKGATTYTATLPSHPAGLTWWVTTTNSRGIQARTPNVALAATAAPATATATPAGC